MTIIQDGLVPVVIVLISSVLWRATRNSSRPQSFFRSVLWVTTIGLTLISIYVTFFDNNPYGNLLKYFFSTIFVTVAILGALLLVATNKKRDFAQKQQSSQSQLQNKTQTATAKQKIVLGIIILLIFLHGFLVGVFSFDSIVYFLYFIDVICAVIVWSRTVGSFARRISMGALVYLGIAFAFAMLGFFGGATFNDNAWKSLLFGSFFRS